MANAGDSRAVLGTVARERLPEGSVEAKASMVIASIRLHLFDVVITFWVFVVVFARGCKVLRDAFLLRFLTFGTLPHSLQVPVPLSDDHNPDKPGELERIESCGGFVSPPPEEGLSARVWLDREMTRIGLVRSDWNQTY